MIKQILIIDDEQDLLDVLSESLKLEGMATQVSLGINDALSAIEHARENNIFFDLIITDWSLSDGSGENLIHRLNAINYKVPILIISGHSSIEVEFEKFKSLGNINFLSKPFKINVILNKIEKILVDAKKV